MISSWDEFQRIVDRKSWAWNRLLGQEDERKLLGFLGTEVATTSGTSIDFTGIPSWVTQIDINFVGVSSNGTSPLLIQIGDAGGIETSGYLGSSALLQNAAAVVTTAHTAGYGVGGAIGAGTILHGSMRLTLENSSAFTWVASGAFSGSDAANQVFPNAGSKSLSAALDRFRITATNGTDTFDAGAINIRMT